MRAFRSLVFVALLAGLAAGAAASAVQALRTWPLIAAAEAIEEAGQAHDHAHGWEPHGALRPALTVIFNVAAGVGFALMLNAVARLRGARLTVSAGVAWGAAGFAAFGLAPALGLPPALPGMGEGALLARQAWWAATAACTLGGIAMLAWVAAPWRWAGPALLALPHLVGAPVGQTGAIEAAVAVPAGLAASFVAASLAGSAVFWLVLGGVSGWAQQRVS